MTIKIDKIIRSKRRSIALMISPDATLIVRAPLAASLKQIEDLVFKHRDWIHKKREQVLKKGIPKTKEFKGGEEFLFLGKSYSLEIKSCWEIELGEKLFFPERYLKKAKSKLIHWFKEQAFAILTQRSNHFSQISGWKFKTLNITSAERRWGSCSSSGSINFSWKLMMAPLEVIDYVVVHELAHIPEKNHSVRFWNNVKSILPNYKIQKKWLKDHGHKLAL